MAKNPAELSKKIEEDLKDSEAGRRLKAAVEKAKAAAASRQEEKGKESAGEVAPAAGVEGAEVEGGGGIRQGGLLTQEEIDKILEGIGEDDGEKKISAEMSEEKKGQEDLEEAVFPPLTDQDLVEIDKQNKAIEALSAIKQRASDLVSRAKESMHRLGESGFQKIREISHELDGFITQYSDLNQPIRAAHINEDILEKWNDFCVRIGFFNEDLNRILAEREGSRTESQETGETSGAEKELSVGDKKDEEGQKRLSPEIWEFLRSEKEAFYQELLTAAEKMDKWEKYSEKNRKALLGVELETFLQELLDSKLAGRGVIKKENIGNIIDELMKEES